MTQGDSDDGQQSEVGSHSEVPLEEATTESLCSGVSDADSDAENEFAEVLFPEVEIPVVEVTNTREFRAALRGLCQAPIWDEISSKVLEGRFPQRVARGHPGGIVG